MLRRAMFLSIVLVMLAAACSDAGSGDASESPDATTSSVSTTTVSTTSTPPVSLPDYADEIAALPAAADDRSLPPTEPLFPVGAYGFSRYVYQQQGDEIVPTLVEGPQGFQVRCQELDKDCSLVELRALYASGDEPPSYLRMDRETLGELVDQLAAVEAAVALYPTLDDACAAGFIVSSAQNANMGIHVVNPRAGSDFDPSDPQMILFAKEGGEQIPRLEIGGCVDGAFVGEDGFVPVGAVFNIEFTADHPEGFAGELDNWHVHYNTCAGGSVENADQVDTDSEVSGVSATKQQCEASGGFYLPVISSWMMHAYVVPEHDPQGGVFSMFNPNIWPLAESPEAIRDLRTSQAGDAVSAPITNFDFGQIDVTAGETVRFANADSVPHTVTAGSALAPDPTAFDSGLLGTAETFEVSFDQAGSYELFCVLHPDMTATVTVS